MKKKEERMEKQMAEVMAENKRLVEPLQKAREEVDELRRQLANYDKDKQSLAVRKNFLFNLLNASSECIANFHILLGPTDINLLLSLSFGHRVLKPG